jgi:hypothetical protein
MKSDEPTTAAIFPQRLRFRRTLLATALLSTAAFLLLPFLSARSAMAASPAFVQVATGTSALNGIACPSASTCVAVGQNSSGQGAFVVATNGVPGAATVVPGVKYFFNVACRAAKCEAVGRASGGNGVIVSISDGIQGAVQVVPEDLRNVACPTATLCLAIGQTTRGEAVVLPIADGVPGADQIVPAIYELSGISCASATVCIAVGDTLNGQGAFFPITDGTAGLVRSVTDTTTLSSIACPTATLCQAVGSDRYEKGVVVPIADGNPGLAREVLGTSRLGGVACLSASNCQAVGSNPTQTGYHAAVVPITNGTAGAPVVVRDAPFVSGVACPAVTSCLAAGVDNYNEGVIIAIDPTGTIPAPGFTFPADRQGSIDTYQPMTWSTTPQAQGYIVLVGMTENAADLVNSGILPASQSSLALPALPAGPTLHATLFVKVAGVWSNYQRITFTARPGKVLFTFPLDGQTNVDTSQAFAWSTTPESGGYRLIIGTSPLGSDLYARNVGFDDRASVEMADLPAGRILYATIYTGHDREFSRYQTISFTAARPNAFPVNGQQNVDTTKPFSWPGISNAQAYYLLVGTTKYGRDLVDSGVLAASKSRLYVPALPTGRDLYFTLFTEVGGTWSYQAITFTAEPGKAIFTYPTNGQAILSQNRRSIWTPAPRGGAYIVVVGTTRYGHDVANSGTLGSDIYAYNVPVAMPLGRVLYATVLTMVDGAWARFDEVSFAVLPAHATLDAPVDGAIDVTTPGEFSWSMVPGAQGYSLVVGTSRFGSNLVSSGVLSPTQNWFAVPSLPPSQLLHATLLTLINGVWNFQAITFTTS